MRLRHAAAVLAAMLLLPPAAHAQAGLIDLLGASGTGKTTPTPSGPPALLPMSAPIDPAEYIVGPGDVLQINLSAGVTRTWDVAVSPEGSLFLPTVGSIPVTGLTLVDARRAVLQRISGEYRGVTIDLRLLRPRTFFVYVAGESPRTGPLEVSAGSRVSEVLLEPMFSAGASRRNVEIRRRTQTGETRIAVDLLRYRLTGRIARDPLLREGDVLFVPIVAGEVSIDGAVGRTGRFELAPGDSLSTLFALAGGLVRDAAERGVLVRFRDATHTDSVSFRVADVTTGRFDPPLRDGDHAFVYFQPRYHHLEAASIFGEIQQPGAYPLLPGVMKLSELVSAAGGFLPTADVSSLHLFRANTAANEPDPEIDRLAQMSRKDMTGSEYEAFRARVAARRQDFRVDWNRVKSEPELDMALRPGDIVRVDPVVATIRVEGEVRQPGLVRFEPGRKVNDYVALAGGYSEHAARGKVRVKRVVTGQTFLARDVASLEPGDLVWVPERGEVPIWQNTQSVLLVLAQIATVVLAVRR